MRGAVLLGLLAAAVVSAGCTPTDRGPQLAKVPEGFGRDPDCSTSRPAIPGDEPGDQLCYYRGFGENPDWITISRYDFPLDATGVIEAHERYRDRWSPCSSAECVRHGDLEMLAIDNRPAWGFLSTTRVQDQPSQLAYTAYVTYDDVTYTIQFEPSSPQYMDEEFLLATVSSFTVRSGRGHTVATVTLGIALACGGAYFFYRLSRLKRESPPRHATPLRARIVARGENAAPNGPRLPPLLDLERRLSELRALYEKDPQLALRQAEELRESHAPCPLLLHLSCKWRIQREEWEPAVELARHALPILIERGHLHLAVELYGAFGERQGELGLTEAQIAAIEDTAPVF
ncbi:MAG: hypothetical protein KBD01_13555 [Acidobacteria bacterium]|nr:hypothetical protein [Acidobacteriota bacterium]